MGDNSFFTDSLQQLANEGLPLLGFVLAALTLHYFVYLVLLRLSKGDESELGREILQGLRLPTAIVLPVGVTQMLAPSSGVGEELRDLLRHFLAVVQIVAISWLLIRITRIVARHLTRIYRTDVADNLHARRIQTQLRILHRVVLGSIGVIGLAAILMTFPKIRQLGTALMTSAGVAGLVLGMAARPALANLIAGVQIALAQPIRLDDVVIVDGEWGRIEQINMTYVVIKIWDDRRLVVPLSHFNDHSFQNWTRTRANLLGSVFLHVDYSAPVEEIRGELKRILDSSGLWDGAIWNLQVTKADERSVELRAIMSAPDSSTAWDLRCLVREKLIRYLQEVHPQCLPKVRGRIESADPGDDEEDLGTSP